VAGPEHIIRVIANVHGNATSCVNLPVQVGLAQFLRYPFSLALALARSVRARGTHAHLMACVRACMRTSRNEKDMESRKEIKRQLQARRDVALELFSTLPCLKRCASPPATRTRVGQARVLIAHI
jgi:aspartate/methionine/tyrosine aminotransferase